MHKIEKVSKYVRYFIVFLAFIHIASFVLTILLSDKICSSRLLDIELGGSVYSSIVEFDGTGKNLAPVLKSEGFDSTMILGSIDILIYSILYFLLFRLFGLYMSGFIFTSANINCIRSMGRVLLLWVGLSIIYPVIVVFIIRITGFSDSLLFHFSFGSSELIRLMLGIVIYVVAWIMAEAMKLNREQELVI
jgi:hypothetical protein